MTNAQAPMTNGVWSSLVIGHWALIGHWSLVVGISRASLSFVRDEALHHFVRQRADRADVERLVVAGYLAFLAALRGEAGRDAVLLVGDARLLRCRVDLDDLQRRDGGAAEHL